MSAKQTVRRPCKFNRVNPKHTVQDKGTAGRGTYAPLAVKQSTHGVEAQPRTRMRSDCGQHTGTEYTEFS